MSQLDVGRKFTEDPLYFTSPGNWQQGIKAEQQFLVYTGWSGWVQGFVKALPCLQYPFLS